MKLNTQTKRKVTKKLPAGKKKKVKVTTSKKNVVKVKYSKKTRRLTMTAVATGSAVVKAKIRSKVRGKKKTKVFIYRVKVNAVKPVVTPTEKPAGTPVPTGGAIDAGPGALKKAKKAFDLQNEYRKQAGVPELEWSPELYDFCIYRIAASGWDEHKNHARDKFNYFGNFAKKYLLSLGENMYSGGDRAEDGVNAWYKSGAHRANMLHPELVTGACVNYRGLWIAVYCKEPESFFQGWQDKPIVKVTIRCYDPETQNFLTETNDGHYCDGHDLSLKWDDDDYSCWRYSRTDKESGMVYFFMYPGREYSISARSNGKGAYTTFIPSAEPCQTVDLTLEKPKINIDVP